ncbi:hypothetical protein V8F20_000771 [Naviculisporaceae sp. PSN 640]
MVDGAGWAGNSMRIGLRLSHGDSRRHQQQLNSLYLPLARLRRQQTAKLALSQTNTGLCSAAGHLSSREEPVGWSSCLSKTPSYITNPLPCLLRLSGLSRKRQSLFKSQTIYAVRHVATRFLTSIILYVETGDSALLLMIWVSKLELKKPRTQERKNQDLSKSSPLWVEHGRHEAPKRYNAVPQVPASVRFDKEKARSKTGGEGNRKRNIAHSAATISSQDNTDHVLNQDKSLG